MKINQSQHTPTPWEVVKATKQEQKSGEMFHIQECREKAIVATVYMCCGWEKSNAEFIVRAVNSHGALLTALKDALEYFEANRDDLYCRVRSLRIKKVIAQAETRS